MHFKQIPPEGSVILPLNDNTTTCLCDTYSGLPQAFLSLQQHDTSPIAELAQMRKGYSKSFEVIHREQMF